MTIDANTNSHGDSEYTIEQQDLLTELDPDLQDIILAQRQGRELPPHSIETITEGYKKIKVVDVIAELQKPGEKIPGLWVVQDMGPYVTGMVDIERIEEVRGKVRSLKAGRRIHETLSRSVPEICATPAQLREVLPSGFPSLDGSNVIVGFVDNGCDFAHPNFRKLNEEKETRILFLWDQREGTTDQSPPDFGYGREFDATAIDKALREADPSNGPAAPHQKLGYELRSGHGTPVMDIAAGNGGGKNPPGVAPGADIIFVDAAVGDFELGESFGNSRHLVDAVKYIFDKASKLNRPAVVNISLSSDAGPHDGSTPVEKAFDYMLETPGRAIVMAAGNSCDSQKHLRRTVRPGQKRALQWTIPPNDNTSNKIEIWYAGNRALEVTLRSPRGDVIGPFPLGTTFTIHRKSESGEQEVAGHVFHRRNDSGNGDNNVVILFESLMEPETWEIELSAYDSLETPFKIDAWIESDDGQPSTFPEQQPSDCLCSIGTLACGVSPIVVGAYNTLDPGKIMESSGTGPTRDGKLKPDVSAPGVGVEAAVALTDSVDRTSGGTSLSAPHVAGLIALLMDAAGDLLTIEQIRDLVLDNARHNPPSPANAWDPRYGMGRICAAASVAEAIQLSPPVITVLEHEDVLAATVVSVDSPGAASEVELPLPLSEVKIAGVSVSVETFSATGVTVPDATTTLASPNGAGEKLMTTPRPRTSGH